MNKWILLIFIIFLLPPFLFADSFHGKIIKKKGNVIITNPSGSKRTPEESNYIALANEKIETHDKGRAVVRFTNGTVTVIGQNSSLGIEKPTLFSHLKGKILFAFAKISGPSRMVQAQSAVFGVRATSFIIQQNTSTDMIVALQEGLLNVESTSGSFEIHEQKELNSFNTFKSDMESGMNAMKKEGDNYIKEMQNNFIAYKRSFMLTPDRVIRISGNRISESSIDDTLNADFTDFKSFAGDHLDGYIGK